MADIIAWVSEKCNRELGDFYFSVLLKWQTWEHEDVFERGLAFPSSETFHSAPVYHNPATRGGGIWYNRRI